MNIEEKIARAWELYHNYNDLLRKSPDVTGLLKTLDGAATSTRAEMENTGVVEICSRCDTNDGGSCCGAGIENKYDEWLILINLLLGVSLPNKRYDSKGCYFLGPAGCTLRARHVICINYVCEKITKAVDPSDLAILREKEGFEIEALFLLKEKIKKIIKTHGR